MTSGTAYRKTSLVSFVLSLGTNSRQRLAAHWHVQKRMNVNVAKHLLYRFHCFRSILLWCDHG